MYICVYTYICIDSRSAEDASASAREDHGRGPRAIRHQLLHDGPRHRQRPRTCLPTQLVAAPPPLSASSRLTIITKTFKEH